jgi:hypothetical protein
MLVGRLLNGHKGVAERNNASAVYQVQHLGSRQAVGCATGARQLSGVVTRIPTKGHFAPRPLSAIREPRPTTPFRFESAVEGTKLFDNAQTPPTKPVE